MADALVAFGANLGDARDTIARAISAFCGIPSIRLVARSSDYRTPPWGVTDQPPFINACIEVATDLTPRKLLDHAHSVEAAFGRDRAAEKRWGPRSLDIDLLTYDSIELDEPGLILPHPRMFERAFVLVPLSDIAPGRVVAGRRIADALQAVDRTGVERLR